MGKSPRRQTSTSSPNMDDSATASSAASSKASRGNIASATANIASDLLAAPTATTRASSAAAISCQDSVIATLQKRIFMLENSLSAAHSAIREQKSRGEALKVATPINSAAAEVPVSVTQLQTAQLVESESQE